jgi:hypothetical protein
MCSPEAGVAAMDLRPLNLGELLDRTFTVYRNHFWMFVGIMALPEAILVAFGIWYSTMLRPFAMFPGSSNPAQAAAQIQRMFGTLFLSAGLLFVAFYLVYTIGLGATTFAVSDVYLGRASTIASAYHKVKGRIAGLLGLSLLMIFVFFLSYVVLIVLAVILGAVSALITPALVVLGALIGVVGGVAFVVWLFLGFTVVAPTYLLEHSGIVRAMARSTELVRGNRGRAFVVLLLMFVIKIAVGYALQMPFLIATFIAIGKNQMPPFWLTGLSGIVGGVAGALTSPLLMISLALFYYDVRVRKEAFDLQVMVASLDAQPGALPPGAAPPPAPIG